MRRRLLAILFAAAVILSLPFQARGAEETGSIRVTLKQGGGELTLYRVGEPVNGGFRLQESYGGGLIKRTDADSPALAQWLAEAEEQTGLQRLLDADRSASFSNLKAGLYLVVQSESRTGYDPFRPFLVELPYEGQWHVNAEPKNARIQTESPPTGQSPQPFLGFFGMLLSGMGLMLCGKKMGKG